MSVTLEDQRNDDSQKWNVIYYWSRFSRIVPKKFPNKYLQRSSKESGHVSKLIVDDFHYAQSVWFIGTPDFVVHSTSLDVYSNYGFYIKSLNAALILWNKSNYDLVVARTKYYSNGSSDWWFLNA